MPLPPPTARLHNRVFSAPQQRLSSLFSFSPAMDATVSASSIKRPHVLVVENDEAARALLTEILSTHYQVEAVNDGLAAWQASQRNPPDLVLIGLYIFGTDSLILTRSLRADKRTAMVPIVLLTASADRKMLLRCLAAGANNFLLKPFGNAELHGCVRLELELHGTTPGSRI